VGGRREGYIKTSFSSSFPSSVHFVGHAGGTKNTKAYPMMTGSRRGGVKAAVIRQQCLRRYSGYGACWCAWCEVELGVEMMNSSVVGTKI
jgi:hypothetical protein